MNNYNLIISINIKLVRRWQTDKKYAVQLTIYFVFAFLFVFLHYFYCYLAYRVPRHTLYIESCILCAHLFITLIYMGAN